MDFVAKGSKFVQTASQATAGSITLSEGENK
jgi:hypothetical protein